LNYLNTMQFNIGLDLNRSHTEMKNNAFPKAKNVLLNDFGNAMLSEDGMINIMSSTYTFSKGAIYNQLNSSIEYTNPTPIDVSSGWSLGLNWTLSRSMFTHTSGVDSNFAQPITLSLSSTNSNYFLVTFIISGLRRGSISYTIGNVTTSGITASINNVTINAIGNSNFIITPTCDFEGSISSIVITEYTHTGLVPFNTTNCNICGYINIKSKLLLFIYDNVQNIAFILRLDPTNNNYDIIVQHSNSYNSFSFNANSIIKGTYFYNYLGQLIISYIDVSNKTITNNTNINKFIPNFWVCNCDEIYINENNKIKINSINSSNDKGQLYNVNYSQFGNLLAGTYFIAYTTIDSNYNESELSPFIQIPVIPLNRDIQLVYSGVTLTKGSSRYDDLNSGASINCIINTTLQYRLIIGYKGVDDNSILYYNTDITTGIYNLYDLSLLQTTSISAYFSNTLVQNAKAIEQYNNQLLLGNVNILDETFNYLDGTTNKTINIELQKVANNIYIINNPIEIPSNPTENQNTSNIFTPDEVYAFYIEFISNFGTSLGCYHIPGRPSTSNELTSASSISGIYCKGNIIPDTVHDSLSNSIIGVFINNNEYYPSNFPNSSLGITGTILNTSSTTVLAGTRVRHHKMTGFGAFINNIIIPSTLKQIISTYKIYYAKRNNNNNLIINTGIIDTNAVSGSTYSIFNYYISFEAIYNKSTIDCIGIRNIGSLSLNSVTTVNTIQYNSSFFSSNIIPLSKLSYRRANVQYASSPLCKQSYFYSNDLDNIDGTLAITAGVYNCYSNNLIGNCYVNYINQKLILSSYTNNINNTGLLLNGDSFISNESYGINSSDQSNSKHSLSKLYYVNIFSKYSANNRYALRILSQETSSYVSTTLVYGGSEYTTGTNIPVISSINGTGMTINILSIASPGVITSYEINTYGSGYIPNELLTIAQDSIYGVRSTGIISVGDYIVGQAIYPYKSTSVVNDNLRLFDNPINTDTYQFYKTCFNASNDLWQPIVFDFTKNFISSFQNRIVRSQVMSTESTVIGWRNITGLDYYELPKIKGDIISLLNSDSKTLFVQCRYALMLISVNDTLAVSTNSGNTLSVQTNDIFAYPLMEVNPNNSIRSSNPFSLISTPIGVMAISDDTKIYIIDNIVNSSDISLFGVQNYLLPKYNIDTDFNFVHITVDIQNKRILFNSPNTNQTLSFHYLAKVFIAEHDYNSKFGIQLNNVTYFIKDNSGTLNGLYTFSNTSNTYLGSSTIRTCKLDIVFNTYQNITKLLQSINWITRAIRIDGSEDENDTFNQLMVYNNTQCSNYIDLRTITNQTSSPFDWFDTSRSLKIYDGFYFNNILDMVNYNNLPFLDSNKEPISNQFFTKNWYNLSNFISNYFIIRFTYNGSNKLIITDIIPELIKTAR